MSQKVVLSNDTGRVELPPEVWAGVRKILKLGQFRGSDRREWSPDSGAFAVDALRRGFDHPSCPPHFRADPALFALLKKIIALLGSGMGLSVRFRPQAR